MLSILVSLVASTAFAQDDMYFVPSKKDKAAKRQAYNDAVYHSGSNRSVDEYNRRGAFASRYDFVSTDSTGNDIIDFTPGTGTYPDSISLSDLVVYNDSIDLAQARSYRGSSYDDDNDYTVSRRLSRFDDFYGPYWAWNRFYSPWYYSPFYYDSWYYSPWYYSSWHYGWYDPWYGPYYDPWYWHGGWGYGYHHWYAPAIVHSGRPGTRNHGTFANINGRPSGAHSISRGVHSRDNSYAATQGRGAAANVRRARTTQEYNAERNYTNTNRSNENTRTYTPSYNSSSSRSSFSGGGNSGGGSVGGSRGGGFSGSFRGRR